MNFKEELENKTKQVNELLLKYLPREEGFPRELAQAMNYSMSAGGKRLRPILMWETYKMMGGSGQVVAPFMAAMEMIHTHSLIHDDLPALDNDEYRRGKKTTHAVYGEALAILSGDALLNYAYEVAFHSFSLEPDNQNIPTALQILAAKTGIFGMLGGQSVDVTNEGREISEEMLLYIYRKKTSALLEGAMMTGAVLAGADSRQLRAIETAAGKIGLAFQIQDDILDVTGDAVQLGKPLHSDEKNNKVTYVTLHGLEDAHQAVKTLSEEAVSLLDTLPNMRERVEGQEKAYEAGVFLRQLIMSLVTRTK